MSPRQKFLKLFVPFVLLLAACGSGKVNVVTQDQDEGQVSLAVGQTLEVRLDSNPTTGYSWQVLDLAGGVLAQEGDAEYKSSSSQPMPGQGGMEIFRFKAILPGEVTLKLVYRRPWETDVEPADTFELAVMVK